MKIEGLGPPQQPEPKNKKADEAKRAANPAEFQRSEPDKIDLSRGDKNQYGIYTSGLKKGLPGQGTAPIQDGQGDLFRVKQLSDCGYYDTPRARSETSDKLIDSDDFKEVVKEFHQSNIDSKTTARVSELRHDKVAEIKKKIAEGFYNNPDNFGAIADLIINHFGL